MTRSLAPVTLLMAPVLAFAGGSTHHWRPVPSNLWAVQAFVPPGTTDARAVQMVPTGVPAVGIPVAVPAGPTGAATGTGAQPNGAPPVPGGQFQPSPAGVPNPGGVKPAQRVVSPPAPAVGSIASSLPGPSKSSCEVTLRLGRMDLAAAGGEFLLPAVSKPAACAPSLAFAAPWLKVTDQTELRFVAEPNTTSTVRETLILIGDRSFLLRQMPPPQPGLAAAPSRLVFAVNKKGETQTKVLTAWSEPALGTVTVRAGHPWLQVTPKKGKQDRQLYEITVQPKSGLAPGRHDSEIEIVAAGAPARSLTIPVVVEVEGVFY